ncbi:hypothetical protein M408DRAFT_23553 [Serendipita vermifera MAFF 305830]|uniref:Uncharacterized protein n=1 Tax=Serendipita vermifera MAFF 305830 TaxID=933852 RepID=A0A0C3BAL4_SERVB|nr:hypothetical protein M408DRAFT_23553 [Serendipita vermifera MAFF 305830]
MAGPRRGPGLSALHIATQILRVPSPIVRVHWLTLLTRGVDALRAVEALDPEVGAFLTLVLREREAATLVRPALLEREPEAFLELAREADFLKLLLPRETLREVDDFLELPLLDREADDFLELVDCPRGPSREFDFR